MNALGLCHRFSAIFQTCVACLVVPSWEFLAHQDAVQVRHCWKIVLSHNRASCSSQLLADDVNQGSTCQIDLDMFSRRLPY